MPQEPMTTGGLPVIDVVPVLRAVCSLCRKTTREGAEPITESLCPECADILREAERARVQVAAIRRETEPRVLRWRDGLPPDPSVKAPAFVSEPRSFEGQWPPRPATRRDWAQRVLCGLGLTMAATSMCVTPDGLALTLAFSALLACSICALMEVLTKLPPEPEGKVRSRR